MEPDCYPVDVLHYLNPHLIWVKMCNRSLGDCLEQIGVYGVIPLDKEIDIEAEGVITKHSDVWQPAATMVMKKVFLEATEITFQPTHIDRRSSIFDTNIHKYGELFIRKADGKRRKLSSYLKHSGFALYDEAYFHQALSMGRILTKLSKNTADEVMKVITEQINDAKSEVSLKKQTTVYEAGKKLEALTAENLDKHNRRSSRVTVSGEEVLNVLNKKFKDLELCKDVDEPSVGRAVGRNKFKDSRESFNTTEDNVENEYVNEGLLNTMKNHKDPVSNYQKMERNDEIDRARRDNKTEVFEELKSPSKKDEGVNFQKRRIASLAKKKSPKNKYPDFDEATQKCIAYSPPGFDKSKLIYKVVPKRNEPTETPKYNVENEAQDPIKDDMFGEVDSDVDIKITNKDVLKKSKDELNSKKYDDKKEGLRNQSLIHTTEDSDTKTAKVATDGSSSGSRSIGKSKLLLKKLKLHRELVQANESTSTVSSTTNKDTSSSCDNKEKEDSDEDVSEIIQKYKVDNVPHVVENKVDNDVYLAKKTINVNPFKNIDPNLSVFVDKLVNPVLMVHTKNDIRIEPRSSMSSIPLTTNIHNALKNMNVHRPMTMQSVSWFSVLKGNSVFLIGPQGSGKTMGYLPSVCRLISDSDNGIVNSVGPTCVIVCATAKSVSEVEHKSKMLLSTKEKVFSCYAGMDMLKITTSLLNGCDLFICTPCVLARLLLQTDFWLDLRRLTTFVLDDCERLDTVYKDEVKIGLVKIKEMLKTRANKEVKVQYILASRVWCDFMESLAKKAPNTVICIGAFQECVLYSKANTTVDFVKAENKIAKVSEFLDKNDRSKKTVVVCRSDDEVDDLEKFLKQQKRIVYACNSRMTLEDLRNLNKSWEDYVEPVLGPILVCCDVNLSHMNVTDAHYLVHYSMPELFSMFCKRFSVLNDYYPSVFKTENEHVSIKIILEDNNAEQLPKICNFIKRCTKEFPSALDGICQDILNQKDLIKASNLVPICGNLLALGECPDFWYCKERHTCSKIHDEPKDWMPTEGIITFQIMHYQTAVLYSSRLLSNVKKDGTKKYTQTYSTLSLKMGRYFSQESNRKLHGTPKIGDICAVSVKENFFIRCQVVHIINLYRNGNPNNVLIKLIDEEKLETSRDIYLYHLPEELKQIKTHVVQVRLAGVLPKDRDITFSDLAKSQLVKSVEKDDELYMRGKVVLTVANTIFVDNIDVCQDLSMMDEVVVKHNFKQMLEPHSEMFPDHIKKLKRCLLQDANADFDQVENTDFEVVEEFKPTKEIPKAQWAHLNREDLSMVYFTSARDPGTFFVRLTKFEDTMADLGKDLDKYAEENREPLRDVKLNDIVLAKFPDDECLERARVDAIEGNKAKCFFVDHGDWREVPLRHLLEIPEKFITRLPFQAIECRLVGVQPVGDDWTDFSTNWLCDKCEGEDLKVLYVQYFSADKAEYTGGKKYAVALIDTNGEVDVVYNNLMIDLNLAAPDETEIDLLDSIDYVKSIGDKEKRENVENNDNDDWEDPPLPRDETLPKKGKFLRTAPLVSDDDSDGDKWDIQNAHEFASVIKSYSASSPHMPPSPSNATAEKLALKAPSSDVTVVNGKNERSSSGVSVVKDNDSTTASTVSIINSSHEKSPVSSNDSGLKASNVDYDVIPALKIQELDSDDFSSPESATAKSDLLKQISENRKPKILWRQNKSTVVMKIMVIGADEYKIDVLDRSISFSATAHEVYYSFEIELYGLVDKKAAVHSNKGQYILVRLLKVMQRNWLCLTRKGRVSDRIVYDVDSIDTSSDEEDVVEHNMAEMIKNFDKAEESESDDSFCDDLSFR